MPDVLVIAEAVEGAPTAPSLEALAAARSLGATVHVLLAGAGAGDAAQAAVAHGADAALHAPHDEPEAVVALAAEAARIVQPQWVLGPRDAFGGSVMPRLAFRLGVALAQDCIAVSATGDGRLQATRPVYGGNALATVACNGRPAVASLRAKAYEALPPDPSHRGSITAMEHDIEGVVKTRVVGRAKDASEGPRLEDARVIVSGGRGLGGQAAFDQLHELADLLGGAVGASRAACDAGWVPSTYQVGLTGKTVTPDLYVAVGISGASQHMAGCSGARDIVAINKDRGANIFEQARFGVAGDWQKVLPAFIDQLHEILGR